MVVSFLDANFMPVRDPIEDYSSLSYTKTGSRWEDHGEFKLVMSPDYFATVLPAKYVAFDGLVFNVTNRKTKDEDANGEMSLSGYSLSVLFDRVVITDNVRVRGNLEVQARAIVSTYAMAGLQTVTGLTLGTLAGHARGIDATAARGTTLASFLFAELNKRGFSWRISYVNDALVFDVLRGLDRTQSQNENTPALFSAEEENVENVEYEQSETEYYNVAIVCDEDETAPKTVIVDQSNSEPVRALYVKGSKKGSDDGESLFYSCGRYASGTNVGKASLDHDNTVNSALFGSLSSDGILRSVKYRNGVAVSCGSDGTNGKYVYSFDNTTFNESLVPGVAFHDVEYNDGISYLVDRTNDKLYVSYDAINFSEAYSGKKLIAPLLIGERFIAPYYNDFATTPAPEIGYLESTDGSAFYERSLGLSEAIYGGIYDICTGIGFVAMCGYRRPTPSSSTIIPIILISRDNCVTWELNDFSSGITGSFFASIASNNMSICAVTDAAYSAATGDGKSWTVVDSGVLGTDSNSTRIVNDGTYYYVLRTTLGYVYQKKSTDGISWDIVYVQYVIPGYIMSDVTYGTTSETGNLYQDGVDALESSRIIDLLNCDVIPDSAPVIGTDCNIGDIVDIAAPKRGIIVSKRLIDLQAIVEPNNHTIKPKFGTDYLSVKKFIKKEIKNRV